MKLEIVCEASKDQQHQKDVETVVTTGDKVISGADDGVIKIWSPKDLQLLHEFKAHDYAVNHLLASGDRLYSASMDQTIKSWQIDTWKLIATFSGHENTPSRIATDGEFIYSGDECGELIKWTKDGKCIVTYGLVEEVWDLHIQYPYIYSIRDRGMTVSEMKGESNNTPVARTVEGRAPLYIQGEHMVMLNQGGVVIDHYFNHIPDCEFIEALKGHDAIITVLGGWGDYLVSAGYDEKLVLWNLKNGEMLHSIPLNGCPTAMCTTNEGEIFIAGPETSVSKYKATP